MRTTTPPTVRLLRIAVLVAALTGCDAGAPSNPVPTETAPTSARAALPGESLAEVMREPDPYARVRRLATLLPILGPESVPEIRQTLIKGLTGMGIAEYELLVRRWASFDPAGASRWTMDLVAPRFRQPGIEVAVETWAQRDPAGALSGTTFEVNSLDRELAQAVHQAIVRGWFRNDRVALETYIRDLGSGVQQQRAILAFALVLGTDEGNDALMRWAEAIPEDDARYKLAVYRQVTSALAWLDPKDAQRWCDAHCDGPFGSALRNALVRTWLNSGEKGSDVLAWVSVAPEGASKNDALSIAFETWALTERAPAMSWMQEKIAEGPAPWVHALFPAYARLLAATAPLEAIQWAGRIDDPGVREETLVRVARKWLRNDEAAATAWLRQSPLSEEARKRAQDPVIPDYLPDAPTS